MLEDKLFIETIKHEYLKNKKHIQIEDLRLDDSGILLTLSHIITNDKILISFGNIDKLYNYLLHEMYDITLYDVVTMDNNLKEELEDYKLLDSYDEESFKRYVLYNIYNECKSVQYTDNCFINQSDELTTSKITYPNDFNSDIILLDCDIKHDNRVDLYRIELTLEIYYKGKKVVKIPNLDVFSKENALEVLDYYLNIDKNQLKLQVLNKLDDIDDLIIETDNLKAISLYEFKNKILIKYLKLIDIPYYIGSNNKIINLQHIREMILEYLRRHSSGVLKLQILREMLILGYGLNGLSFNNFMECSKMIYNEYNEITNI